jgi:hypothetical protein
VCYLIRNIHTHIVWKEYRVKTKHSNDVTWNTWKFTEYTMFNCLLSSTKVTSHSKDMC